MACEQPAHRDLVGLWGFVARDSVTPHREPTFHSQLIWDGCFVTVWLERPSAQDETVETMADLQLMAQERRREELGVPTYRPHERAHRMHVYWRGDELVATSELTEDFAVARREVGPDGRARWGLIRRSPNTVPLERFDRQHCLDWIGQQLLCARDVVRAPGEWRD
ncbi:MAG TPA: hypothetical protein RMH99_00165 [Sandaracinaceae bacterium LLY-WYZ-13_1]|nr:hypothetical protein [Sandaracinaceae bacterium LLY-WYZ-13_1]